MMLFTVHWTVMSTLGWGMTTYSFPHEVNHA